MLPAERAVIEARFWSKVNRSGDGCWLWTASTTGQGHHGQFTFKERPKAKQRHAYAHRVAWELSRGPIPAGLVVCHHCDVPRRCRPDHLFIGTQADNLNDARQKHRLIDGLSSRKLSDDAYRDILSSSETGRDMARKHGVSDGTVSRIRAGLQGSTFHRSQLVLERVAFRLLPVYEYPIHTDSVDLNGSRGYLNSSRAGALR